MSILKQVIKYTNAIAIEATWVDQTQLPDVEVPAVLDEDGNVVTPAHTVAGEVVDTQVKSTAYAGDQMDLFRADVATYGGDISEYEPLIAEVEAEWAAQPVPTPLPAPAPETLPVTVTVAEWDALCDAANVPQLKKGKK